MIARTLLIASCAFLAQPAKSAEPIVQGKPLGYWTLLLHQSELQVEAGEWRPGPDPFADYAMRSISSLGPHAAPALPALLAWFSERAEEGSTRDVLAARLARTLQAIGPEAKSAVPLLL